MVVTMQSTRGKKPTTANYYSNPRDKKRLEIGISSDCKSIMVPQMTIQSAAKSVNNWASMSHKPSASLSSIVNYN